MNAEQYLKQFQRYDELYAWFVEFIPQNTVGTDLRTMPDWLLKQREFAKVPLGSSTSENISNMFETIDVARAHFGVLKNKLPHAVQQKLGDSDTLAVGSTHSSEFNGAVHRVALDAGTGHVITLPIGGYMLLWYIATLITVHSSDKLCNSVIAGDLEIAGFKEFPDANLARSARSQIIRPQIQSQFKQQFLAAELSYTLRNYAELGVSIPVELVRRFLPVPLIGDGNRIGHPLECSASLGDCAFRFLLLHECGHICLGHTANISTKDEPFRLEFEADIEALSLAVELADTVESFASSCLGAWTFLHTAKWLEKFTIGSDFINTHPPASDRLMCLRAWLYKTKVLKCSWRRQTLRLLRELESTFDAFYQLSERDQGLRLLTENCLQTSLSRCARLKNSSEFEEDIPRWILFGNPFRLCRELANSRWKLEESLRRGFPGADDAEKLRMIMWVFDKVLTGSNDSLKSAFTRAYDDARSPG